MTSATASTPTGSIRHDGRVGVMIETEVHAGAGGRGDEGTPCETLVLRNVSIGVSRGGGFSQPLVTDVSLAVRAGESVGLVGESGSGKSITALACLGLLDERLSVTAGDISVEGRSVLSLAGEELRRLRGPVVGMIFQDPMTSLDPCFTIGSQMIEAILAHRDTTAADARRLALEMLELVEIPKAAERLDAFPHEFSGGMRQRVMIATALILRPSLLVADEPTSALDVTTQASIVALVNDLRKEIGMSVLWISHDLGLTATVAERMTVLYAGEIVEQAASSDIFHRPVHPYTSGLIASSRHGKRGQPFSFVPGSVPEPAAWPKGCRFRPRCDRSVDECAQPPALEHEETGHSYRCFNPLPGSRM